jgi:hypothetical protein
MEKYWRYILSAFFGVLLFAFDFEMFLASIPGLIALFNFNLNDIIACPNLHNLFDNCHIY